MPMQILIHVPSWVWALFVCLLALGLVQARNRRVSRPIVFIQPVVLIPLSLYGIEASFGLNLGAFIAWLIGVGAAATLNAFVFLGPRNARYDNVGGRFEIPGSFVPLALIMIIFAARFVVGVTTAINPMLVATSGFVWGLSAVLGFSSGLILARASRILRSAPVLATS